MGVKLENVTIQQLGRAEKVVVDKDSTLIVEGAGRKQDIRDRMAQIRRQIEQTSCDYDREKLQKRLAKLTGGVAVLNVGAPTEMAMMEKKARVEGALHATRAAVEEGVVEGGGLAYLRSAQVLDRVRERLRGDDKYGADVLARAIECPMRQIAQNAGRDGSTVAAEARERRGSVGFDANTGRLVDMFKAGIIDPTKVSKIALQNAASLAGLVLTTETLVTELKEEDEEKAEATEGAVT